ncbi:MAG TPA: MG2 domain-containing protein [bacterium]
MSRVRGARWSTAVAGAVLAMVLGAAAAAQPLPGGAAAPAGRPAPGQAPGDAFTIRAIAPNLAEQSVTVRFTRPVDRQAAHEHLRIVPPPPSFHVTWSGEPDTLVLRGSFRHGTRYVLKFSGGFVAGDGTPYTETLKEVLFPDKAPALLFSGVGSVIERSSRQLVHFDVVNVGSTLLETLQLSPAAALSQGEGAWADRVAAAARLVAALDGAIPDGDPLRRFLSGRGTRRDLFDTTGPANEERSFSIPLSQRPERGTGKILLARLRDNAVGGSAETKPALFNVTDLGITCLAGSAATLVWVTSLETGLPVGGVEVAGFTADRVLFHAGRTDGDGLLAIPAGAKEGFSYAGTADRPEVRPRTVAPEGYRLQAVAAVTADDAAVQAVPEGPHSAVTVPGIRQTSAVTERPEPANAVVFTERGAYRPGETVFVKGIVRLFRDGKVVPPVGARCTFEITDSRGRRVREAPAVLSEFGTAALEASLPASAPLGEYRVELRPAGGPPATATFRVEEFVPPRHFARLSFAARRRTDDTFTGRPVEATFLAVTVEGGYYAGGPVKNGRVRWQLAYGPSAHRVKGWDDYVFGHEMEEGGAATAPLESGEAFLDADGRLTLEFPVSAEVLAGERTFVVSAAVLDFDGRAASATETWRPETGPQIGIASHAKDVVAGEEQRVTAVLVDAGGERVREGTLTAEVLRRSWTYYRKRNLAGNDYWVSEQVWKRARTAEVPIRDGRAVFEVSFDGWGEYLVRFSHRADDRSVCSSATRFQVGWERWDEQQGREQGLTRIPLSTDRPRYRPGQTARLRAGARQRAAAWLFTIERQAVLSAKVLRTKGELPELQVELTDASAPNVYASLVGTVPRGPFPVYTGRIDEGVPAFLHGVANLPVVKLPASLSVEIAPGVKQELEAQPGGEVTLALAVRGESGRGVRAELAVAVVDESVLALTGHRAPDVAGITRFDLPLGIFLSDTRRFLIPQTPFRAVRAEALTGGGEGEGTALETRRLFKPVAYWNPALATDAEGRAQVRFALPDQMTAFRVTVVACDAGSAFGTAERTLRVSKPFSLEAGLPRIFTKGDRFRFTVGAFNRTDESDVMDFALAAEGPLVLTVGRRSYPLTARERADVAVAGSAEGSGEARVRFVGRFGAHADAVEHTIPVRSGHVRGQQVWYGSVKGESSLVPSLPSEVRAIVADRDLLGETTAVIAISGSPFLRMTAGLRYLLQYPYGCIEQTASGVLPLAALRGILSKGMVPGIAADEADPFLAKGVERLLSMQTDAGGFGYWPGDREASPWGTFYAATALAEARDAGMAVPEEALQRLAGYLREDRLRKPPEEAGAAMALYLLARLGKAQASDFTPFRAGLGTQAWEPRILALLAASYGGFMPPDELGMAARAALEAPRGRSDYHYGFNGRNRPDAMALLLADRVLPGDPAGAALAAKLLESRDVQGRWGRTSDTGWALAALGRHFVAEAENAAPHRVAVRVAGGAERVLEVPARGAAELGVPVAEFLASPSVTFSSDPSREVLFSLALTFPRVDYAARGNDGGFRIVKRIENADGSAAIRVGDIVRVTVEFSPPEQGSEFTVLDDPLPAGLVAINAAFKSEEGVPRDNDAVVGRERGDEDFWGFYWDPAGYYRFVPDHLELRDDRVAAFRQDLWGWRGTLYRFVYYARAVCEGEFVVPSTKIERMYEPEVNGYTPRSVLQIGGRVR